MANNQTKKRKKLNISIAHRVNFSVDIMKCLNQYRNFLCNFLLLIAILNTNLIKCDILVNKTSNQNASACNNNEECVTKTSTTIVRDHHVLIMDYMKESSTQSDRLKHISILYGIILLAQENELNQRCYNEIMQIYEGINHKEIWAIKGELEATWILIHSDVFEEIKCAFLCEQFLWNHSTNFLKNVRYLKILWREKNCITRSHCKEINNLQSGHIHLINMRTQNLFVQLYSFHISPPHNTFFLISFSSFFFYDDFFF